MKSITFSLFLWIFFLPFSGFSQEFSYHSENPFQIDLVNEASEASTFRLIFADRDADGDLDIFHVGLSVDTSLELNIFNFDYVLEYQENTGTPYAPQFGERQEAFQNFEFPFGYFLPAMGDLDLDGMLDLVAQAEIDTFSEAQQLLFYQNESALQNGSFSIRQAQYFDLDPVMPRSFYFPELFDMDADGDLDIMLSGFEPVHINYDDFEPSVLVAKNIGSATQPEFLGWFDYPYHITKGSVAEFLKPGDIDNDGDIDLFSISQEDDKSQFSFRENTSEKPAQAYFAEPVTSVFGLPVSGEDDGFLDFNFVDLDTDGDLDLILLLVINDELVLRYYENNLCAGVNTEIDISICEGEEYEGHQESGTYIDQFNDQFGCDSSRILNLTVHPIHEDFIVEELCEGESFMAGGQSFTESGTYQITMLSEYACDSIIHLDLDFEILNLSVDRVDHTLTAQQSGVSYQWFNCDTGEDIPNANMQSFTPEISGNYAVEIESPRECVGFSECVSVIISATQDETISRQIEIFPNPARDKIFLKAKGEIEILNIQLLDTSGRSIRKWSYSKSPAIDLGIQEPGLYMLLIETNKENTVKKLIIL